MNRHRLMIGVGLVLSVVLLWWALRDVSVSELLEHLAEADPWYLLLATLAATLTFALRAIRWRVLLSPALERPLGFRPRFAAVSIGFMTNNLLPARLGEFARAYSLSRISPVSMSAGIASLVVERLLDALVLMTFLIPPLLTADSSAQLGPWTLRDLFLLVAALVLVGLVTLGLVVRYPNGFLRLAERWTHRVLSETQADRITGVAASFIAGLGALRHGHLFFQAIFWSFVVWLWNAFSFYLGFLAFGLLEPGVSGALLLQSLIGFAVSIPSSPGFFGPFEAAARVAMGIYEVDPSRTISFAASYHILTFIPITLIGIYYMQRLGISREEIGHSDELVEAEIDADAARHPAGG